MQRGSTMMASHTQSSSQGKEGSVSSCSWSTDNLQQTDFVQNLNTDALESILHSNWKSPFSPARGRSWTFYKGKQWYRSKIRPRKHSLHSGQPAQSPLRKGREGSSTDEEWPGMKASACSKHCVCCIILHLKTSFQLVDFGNPHQTFFFQLFLGLKIWPSCIVYMQIDSTVKCQTDGAQLFPTTQECLNLIK